MRMHTGRRGGRRGERALRQRLGEIGYDGIPPALTQALRTMVARQELETGAPLPRSTAVASVLPGEEADIIAHALSALVAHDYERRVCRVDGSWLAAPIGTAGRGASDVHDLIHDGANISDWLVTARGQPRLATLRAGHRAPDEPLQRVQAADLRRLIARLADEFDHIVLEAPGLLANRDGETVVNESDGYVLVVRRGTSSEGQVQSATSLASSTMCLGAVLTDYDRRRPRGFNRRSRRANQT